MECKMEHCPGYKNGSDNGDRVPFCPTVVSLRHGQFNVGHRGTSEVIALVGKNRIGHHRAGQGKARLPPSLTTES